MNNKKKRWKQKKVAPRAGAWIEMPHTGEGQKKTNESTYPYWAGAFVMQFFI